MPVRINTEGFVPEYTACPIESQSRQYQPLPSHVNYGGSRSFAGSFFRASQLCSEARFHCDSEPQLTVMTAVTLPDDEHAAELSRWHAPVERAKGKLVSLWQHRVEKSRRCSLETHEMCALEHLERACEDGERITEAHHKTDGLQLLDDIEYAARRLRRVLES